MQVNPIILYFLITLITGLSFALIYGAIKIKRIKSENKSLRYTSKVKTQFLANMSHEIRTPLNGLLGITEILLESNTDPTDQENLTIIKKCGDDLLSIINDILDYSKISAGKFTIEKYPVQLRINFKEVLDLLALKAKKKSLKLRLDIDKNVPETIMSDPTRLKQIITNLVSNAIKFTDKGYIDVIISAEKISEKAFKIHCNVRDTGVGIAKESQDNLFEEYNQADLTITRNYGGTGLGLAICKGICESMNGEIWFEENPEGGSQFKFTIEAFSAEGELRKVASSEFTVNNATRSVKILLAEDNIINQKLVTMILKKISVPYSIANNGKEAVDLALKEDFDLVLMDCRMPIMDGLEAARIIRKMKGEKSPKIVALTAGVTEEERLECARSGMEDFFTKPLDVDKLYNLLKEISLNKLSLGTFVTDFSDLTSTENSNMHSVIRSKKQISIHFYEENDDHYDLFREMLLDSASSYSFNFSRSKNFYQFEKYNQSFTADIIILDLNLQFERDVKQIEQFKKVSQSSPVITLLASEDQKLGEKCIESGATNYLSKLSVNSKTLLKNINEIIEAPKEATISEIRKPKLEAAIGKKKILVVDDDSTNIRVLEAFLANSETNIKSCENGQEAFELLKNNIFDLVVMDIQMPVMDGYEATRAIRNWEEENNKMPTTIWISTASNSVEDINKIKKSGCDDYILKPLKKDDLIFKIDNYFENKKKIA